MLDYLTSLLQAIPESFVLVFLIMVFLKLKIEIKKIIIVGLIDAFLLVIYRSLPLSFGFHSVLVVFTLSLLTVWFFSQKILNSFMAVIKTYILLNVIEMINLYAFLLATKMKAEELLANEGVRTMAIIIQVCVLFLIGFIIYRKKGLKEWEGRA